MGSTNEKKNEVQKNETNSKVEYIPPDGGWGWVIVFAYIIAGVSIRKIAIKKNHFNQTYTSLQPYQSFKISA